MSVTQFSVSWDSYKKSVSNGLSRLQQNGEFVDMTLAAEGHLVKVHQNLVALTSPYLKAMLQSASCQHPVIFLNDVNFTTLGFILEYIYTGEVNVPADTISAFIKACRALCIGGVENIVIPKEAAVQRDVQLEEQPVENLEEQPVLQPEVKLDVHPVIQPEIQPVRQSEVQPVRQSEVQPVRQSDVQPVVQPVVQPEIQPLLLGPLELPSQREVEIADNNFAAHITINSENYNLEISSINNDIMQLPVISDVYDDESPIKSVPVGENIGPDLQIFPIVVPSEDQLSNILTTTKDYTTDIDKQNKVQNLGVEENTQKKPKPIMKLPRPGHDDKDQVFYTISSRDSIQLILNRYIYCCHHQSKQGRLRRWRCINYRQLQCRAFIDTDSNEIIHRSENHCHHYHDNKILKKFKSKSVYSSISEAAETAETFNKKKAAIELWPPQTNNRWKKRNDCQTESDMDI